MDKLKNIPGELRFKGNNTDDMLLNISLDGKSRGLIQGNQNKVINLQEQYELERNHSTIFRISTKFQTLYDNVYVGSTSYSPFKNNLYYHNPEVSIENGFWSGYPQYHEFEFFRNDINNTHIDFKTKSAYTYNWNFYFTYSYKNINHPMRYVSDDGLNNNFLANEGIPYVIKKRKINGKPLIIFRSPVKHGLIKNEYVMLPITFNGRNVYPIYGFGDGSYNSDDYVFTIYDIGYGNIFSDDMVGTFKRVKDNKNVAESTSEYYCRQHKVLLTHDDININKAGFEENIFYEDKKLEYAALTPNNERRISIKTKGNSYAISNKKDIDIAPLVDNNGLPVTQIFVSVIHKGYTGFFNKPNNTLIGGKALKLGWDFNLNSGLTPSTWWNNLNTSNKVNIGTDSYTREDGGNNYKFFYNKNFEVGDTMVGDFCEYNKLEMRERVISKNIHKISFNDSIFAIQNENNNNPKGYYYMPHYPVKVRDLSSYIEYGKGNNIGGLPDYAYFSENTKKWIWRDLLTYGFVDIEGNGVDYPFTNNTHYPFSNFIFRLIPEGHQSLVSNDIIFQPNTDECE